MFTVTVLLASYLNKWGYLSYFNISPIYINFNFTQLLPSLELFQIWLLLPVFCIFILFLDKISINLQNAINQEFQPKDGEKVPPEDIISYVIKKLRQGLWCNAKLILVIGLLVIGFLLNNQVYNFALVCGIIIGSIAFFTLFTKHYMITLILIVLWIALFSFKLGNYSAIKGVENKEFDETIDGEYIIDYFDDKYILISVDDIKNFDHEKDVTFEIHSIVEKPIKTK